MNHSSSLRLFAADDRVHGDPLMTARSGFALANTRSSLPSLFRSPISTSALALAMIPNGFDASVKCAAPSFR